MGNKRPYMITVDGRWDTEYGLMMLTESEYYTIGVFLNTENWIGRGGYNELLAEIEPVTLKQIAEYVEYLREMGDEDACNEIENDPGLRSWIESQLEEDE